MKTISKEELKNKKTHHLTVGDLKKFLEKHDLPDDAPVLIQRVEDIYYEKYNWSTYNKKGDSYYEQVRYNKKVEGEFKDTERYPGLVGKDLKVLPEEKMEELRDEYTPAFCCAKYPDDDDVLFINLHY